MKVLHILISLITLICLVACVFQKKFRSESLNNQSTDTRGNIILVGKSTKQRLQEEPFGAWFNKNYSDYKVDSATANILRSKLADKRFVLFMGTWCGDSRQEVPRIYKILDYCKVPDTSIRLINLDVHDSVYKQSPSHEERGLNIHRVPDLLIYENGKEMGRIIERPVISWEKDLLAIVLNQKYQSPYRIVTYLQGLFQSLPEEEIENDIVKISDSLRSHTSTNEGLQSYGSVLLATNEITKALIVHRLNTILYPTGGNGFVALADTYLKKGDRAKAKLNYEHALILQPGNEKATMMLAHLMK